MEKKNISVLCPPDLHKQVKIRMLHDFGQDNFTKLILDYFRSYVSEQETAIPPRNSQSGGPHDAMVAALINLLENGDPNIAAAVKSLLLPYAPVKSGKARTIKAG